MNLRSRLILCSALALATSGVYAATSSAPSAVGAAVAHHARPPVDRARDGVRKPTDVLAFAGIKAGDKVVDLIPGDGYYTRILSKLVGPTGHVYMYVPIAGMPPQVRAAEHALMKKGQVPATDPVDMALSIQDMRGEFGNVTVIWEMLYAYGGNFGLPEQVDAVFTANAYHDLHVPGFVQPTGMFRGRPVEPPLPVVDIDKAIFRALKPGGSFVVVDDAADKGAGFAKAQSLHRSEPDAVKAEITKRNWMI